MLDCGFVVPAAGVSIANENDQLLIDNDLSDLLGQYALSLCVARQRRCLWLVVGWPARMYGILAPEAAE